MGTETIIYPDGWIEGWPPGLTWKPIAMGWIGGDHGIIKPPPPYPEDF